MKVKATYRVVPSSGIVKCYIKDLRKLGYIELEKWKFENLTETIPAIEMQFLDGNLNTYESGNLQPNTFLLHFNGLSAANFSSDASNKECIPLSMTSHASELTILFRNASTKAPLTFDAVQLWFNFVSID